MEEEKKYEDQAKQPDPSSKTSNNKKDDNIEDADFEVVDEK